MYNNGGGRGRGPQVIKGMKRRQRRDGKETFPRCFVEHRGELLKIEIGPSKKDGVEAWCTVTNMGRANGNDRGGFGRGGDRSGRSNKPPMGKPTFEDKMSRFLKDSEERISSLKKNTESKRGGRGAKRV